MVLATIHVKLHAHIMTHIIGLDIETSGPSVTEHRVLAIGGAIVAVKDAAVVRTFLTIHNDVPTVESNVLPPNWDLRTFTEFWTSPDKGDGTMTPLMLLQRTAVEMADTKSEVEMTQALAAWLRQAFHDFPDAIIVVDTVSFDTSFLNYLLAKHTDLPNLLYAKGKYRTVRDLYSWAYGLAGRSFGQAKDGGGVKLACQRLGIEPPDEAMHNHNPVNDATYIATAAALLCRAIEGVPM